MKKNKYIDILLKESTKEEIKTVQKNKLGIKILRKILIRITTFITLKFLFLILFIIILLLPLFLVAGIGISLFGGGSNGSVGNNSDFYIEGNPFISNFSEENLDTPLGIPVERGIINYGFDYNKYKTSFITSFLKLFYIKGQAFYSGHRGIDFSRVYSDKSKGYKPYIFSTLRGIVKKTEKREEVSGKLKYTKKLYSGGSFIDIISTTTKSKEQKIKPYGNYVIISNMEGSIYVLYAHMSSVNKNMFEKENIPRGAIVGIMGTSGNSTGVHLHYEIRYCGDNPGLKKRWVDCYPINPLGTINGKQKTFLGFSTLPKVNRFVAGNIKEIKNKTRTEKIIFEELNKKFNEYCNKNKILFLSRKLSCKEAYPVYYLEKKIGKSNNNSNNINQSLDFELKGTYIYKLEQLKKKYKTPEKFYNAYFENINYKNKENPYVYNMIDSSKIFLKILDENGNFIGRYNNYGALTIYNQLKK